MNKLAIEIKPDAEEYTQVLQGKYHWISLILVTAAAFFAPTTYSAGMWNGQDLLHVPMSWCIVSGSPAQTNPNILGLNGTLDSSTDAVIWRRHERPTDNIFINQSGISLRSAINDAWGSFNFPLIPDTDTANGTVGDVNGWNVNSDGTEFTNLLNACDMAYSGIGKAGIGITAVNVGLFHDNGNSAADGNTQFDYVGVIGWGGCNESTPGTCVIPYDGRVMVIDNNYLYPTVADRTFPPSPADPAGNLAFPVADPLDQLTGHEVGHSLSLDHRNPSTALMFQTATDNTGDGNIDNISLNNSEINALRANALNVPGLESDPPGVFNPGNFIAMRLVDEDNAQDIAPYLDIASVKLVKDQKKDEIHVGLQLMGLIPRFKEASPFYVFAIDADGNSQTGCSSASSTNNRIMGNNNANIELSGIEMFAVATPRLGDQSQDFVLSGQAIICRDGQLVALDDDLFDIQLHTLRMHPHFAAIPGRKIPADFVADVYHTINLKFDNSQLLAPIQLDASVKIQAFAFDAGGVRDRFGQDEKDGRFVLELPSFPHCFPQGDGTSGHSVTVKYERLLPNRGIHALLGADLVLDQVITDSDGAGELQLPIPANTPEGLHLVTIGHDGLALTADCTVNVVKKSKPIPPVPGSKHVTWWWLIFIIVVICVLVTVHKKY
jgi:hypothetical protein